ncbi:GL18206 [Drosophila persimilis]|uniref:GL18206 n=1 Tax=Drosophila persimilis TaxID=7234 RepID=B4HBB5_DROPE|nr:GL18206 [Drosophila persimilis]
MGRLTYIELWYYLGILFPLPYRKTRCQQLSHPDALMKFAILLGHIVDVFGMSVMKGTRVLTSWIRLKRFGMSLKPIWIPVDSRPPRYRRGLFEKVSNNRPRGGERRW